MFFFRRDIFATIKEIEVTIQRLVLMGILRSILAALCQMIIVIIIIM